MNLNADGSCACDVAVLQLSCAGELDGVSERAVRGVWEIDAYGSSCDASSSRL